MNKDLIIRILGKEQAIKFDDEIFNLREIVQDLRHSIILHLSIEDKTADDIKKKFISISITMKLLLKTINNVKGYTNSKNYLKNFIEKICLHIKEISSALNDDDFKNLTYHTNCLADLVFSY